MQRHHFRKGYPAAAGEYSHESCRRGGRAAFRECGAGYHALRVHDLSLGYSGCRMETIRYLLAFLNQDVIPVVPEKGSVGASGDLAPTAHLGLVLIGRGEAFHHGERVSGAEALSRIGLSPLQLAAGRGWR